MVFRGTTTRIAVDDKHLLSAPRVRANRKNEGYPSMFEQAETRGRAAAGSTRPSMTTPADKAAERWGITTRDQLLTHLQTLIEGHRRSNKLFTFLLLELRTDTMPASHQERHLILARLRSGLRRTDGLVWSSADTLAITLENITSRPIVSKLRERFQCLLAMPGFQVQLLAVGSANYPADGTSATELLQQAELTSHRNLPRSHADTDQPLRRASSASQRA